MSQDSLLKLRDRAAKDPAKVPELLDKATTGYMSPEAKTVLEKKPEFNQQFLESQAKQFNVPVSKMKEIAERVVTEGVPAFSIERREFSVDEDVRARFTQLYNEELKKRRTCPRPKCGAEFRDLQQVLVHHSLHLLFESDSRTQKMMWEAIRELNYPTQEKGVSAILPAEERRRMLLDPRMRERLRR